MKDPLESQKQEVLGHAEFARLAELVGADADQKRDELAQSIAESFRSKGQIRSGEEGEPLDDLAPPERISSVEEYVHFRARKAAGKKRGKSKKLRKRNRTRIKPDTRIMQAATPPAMPKPKKRPHDTPHFKVEEDKGEPCHVTWQQAEGKPETAASLEQLPAGIRLSEHFPEPIHFDAAARQLMYRGFLTTNSYRYLLSLSSDLAYLRAINELNARTVATIPQPPQRKIWWWAVLLACAMVIGAGAIIGLMMWR